MRLLKHLSQHFDFFLKLYYCLIRVEITLFRGWMRSASWNACLDPSCACLFWLMKTWILIHKRTLPDSAKATFKVINLTVHILEPSFLISINLFGLWSKLSHWVELRVDLVEVPDIKHNLFRLHSQVICKLCIFLLFKLQEFPDLALNFYYFLFVVFKSWLDHSEDRSACNKPSVHSLNLDCRSDIDIKCIHDWFLS